MMISNKLPSFKSIQRFYFVAAYYVTCYVTMMYYVVVAYDFCSVIFHNEQLINKSLRGNHIP